MSRVAVPSFPRGANTLQVCAVLQLDGFLYLPTLSRSPCACRTCNFPRAQRPTRNSSVHNHACAMSRAHNFLRTTCYVQRFTRNSSVHNPACATSHAHNFLRTTLARIPHAIPRALFTRAQVSASNLPSATPRARNSSRAIPRAQTPHAQLVHAQIPCAQRSRAQLPRTQLSRVSLSRAQLSVRDFPRITFRVQLLAHRLRTHATPRRAT